MPTLLRNGFNMYYELVGEGVPLLLLHGLGSCAEDWELQLPAFARHFQVVAADMRGHGRSDKPPGPYSVPQMAGDVLGLLDALEIESTHIVGLSMGGMVAFQLVVSRPERVRSLVIVNSAPALVPRTAGEWLRVQQRLALARLFPPARSGQFLSQRLFPKPEQEEMRQQLIERWARNDRRAYLASMRALVGWSVMDQIGVIRQPVLVISGDRDYTPVESKRAYVTRLPNARLMVIEDSGHATPIDQSERFNAGVLDFLLSLNSAPAIMTVTGER